MERTRNGSIVGARLREGCVGLLAGILLASSGAHAQTAGSAAPATPNAGVSLPQQKFFSSIKQSLSLDPEHDVVFGHFDLGTPPNVHRYYCLVDARNGRRQPNGVLGEPQPRADGMTGLKIDSVSLFGCDDAATHGILVSTGYRLMGPAASAIAPPPRPASPAPASPPPEVPAPAPTSPATAPQPAPAASMPAAAPAVVPAVVPVRSTDRLDVAGIRLGMSLDEARAALKAKSLREYRESAETLGYWDPAKRSMRSLASGRFVNVISTWSAPNAGDARGGDGESYEVMFTPVPGRQRVVAIVHTVSYSPANAVREDVLAQGLVRKYGGFSAASDLPDAPTWRYQAGGTVEVGDRCGRRALFGGIGRLRPASAPLENVALKRTPAELRDEIRECGVAIVTEDHRVADGGAMAADRRVNRFTVSAYGPAIALEGAESAAQLIHAAGGAVGGGAASQAKAPPAPIL